MDEPHLGNGHAVVPYYWSRAGYAALAVSGDDNSPAGWTASQPLGRVSWVYPGKSADLYLMPAATLDAAARAYAKLSGMAGVPPRWTFGYLQSRWGWKDRAYIEDTLHQFISRKLPVDAFIFDFEWYTDSPDYLLKPRGLADVHRFFVSIKIVSRAGQADRGDACERRSFRRHSQAAAWEQRAAQDGAGEELDFSRRQIGRGHRRTRP